MSESEDCPTETVNYLPHLLYKKFFLLEKPIPGGGTNFKAKCLLCKNEYGASTASNRNLYLHLERKHKAALTQLQDETPRKRKASSTGESQLSLKRLFSTKKEITQERLDDLVQRVVIENRLPYRFVESESFKSLISELAPGGLKLVCEKTLRVRIQQRYNQMKDAVKKDLASVSRMCVTADAWKSRGKGYIALVALWLDPESLECRSAALALRRVIGSQSYDVIANLLSSVFEEFEIEGKISSVVTDNGSNFCKAFRVFSQVVADVEVDEDDIEIDDDEMEDVDLGNILDSADFDDVLLSLPPHRRCASHTINRIAVHDIEKIYDKEGPMQSLHKAVVTKSKALWNFQSRSTLGHDDIKETLGTLFVVPNETRWNSKYQALCCVLGKITQQTANLRAVFEKADKKGEYFTSNEITWLKEYVEVTQPLADALDVLQQQTNVCVGYLLPTLYRLLNKMTEMQARRGAAGLKYMKPVAKCIQDGIQQRFGHLLWDQDLVVAACLVPVFRLHWITSLVPNGNAKVDEARRWLHEAAETIVPCYTGSPATPEEQVPAPSQPSTSTNAFHRLFGFAQSPAVPAPRRSTVSEELDQYLAGAVVDFTTSPGLKKLFIHFNTCVPSSGSIERFFSRAKLVMVPGRSRLTDQNFERLVLLEANCEILNNYLRKVKG